jgi:hypothetical protein
MRKTEVVKVPEAWGARDIGKHFLISEWSADHAEKWAFRMLIAYNRGGGQIPVEVLGHGMQTIFMVGINTFLRGQMDANEVIPILDELLECAKIIRDPTARGVDGAIIATDILPMDIEEVRTRLWLRSEVLRLHTNFSMAELLSSLLTAAKIPASNSIEQETSLQP